jgi:hypothetical protein
MIATGKSNILTATSRADSARKYEFRRGDTPSGVAFYWEFERRDTSLCRFVIAGRSTSFWEPPGNRETRHAVCIRLSCAAPANPSRRIAGRNVVLQMLDGLFLLA